MKKLVLFAGAILAAIFSHAQWGSPVRLTDNPDSSLTSYPSSRCIAATDNFVHVVWYENRDGNWEIYYKRSADEGISWEPDVRLTNADYRSSTPSIAAIGANVYVVWQDFRDGIGNREIYFKRSTDGGISWGEDVRLTFDPALSYLPSISVSGSVVHVVWVDERDSNNEIYYKRSTDGGISWESDIRLTNNVYGSFNPSIATSGTNVHVVWNDTRDGNEIYYKRSTDGGINWESDTRLTEIDMMNSQLPSIGVSGSLVHITWSDDRDGLNPEVYYKRSLDGGTSWEEDTRLTFSEWSISWFSNIAVSGQVVHVVWEDDREGTYHIYCKRSDDEGINWGADSLISGEGVMISQRPFVCVSGSDVHSVWFDDRDGNPEIYYNRDSTGGFPVGIGNSSVNNSGQSFMIYPNPASSVIQIHFNDEQIIPKSPGNEKSVFLIRNILGETMITRPIRNGEAVMDVSTLPNGLYFARITTANKQTVSTKLIILK